MKADLKENRVSHSQSFYPLSQMQRQQENIPEDSFPCPSFSSYSNDKLADTAERVSREYPSSLGELDQTTSTDRYSLQNDDEDVEFFSFRKAANEVYFDGHIGPVFPIFNRDLLMEYEASDQQNQGRDSNTAEEEEEVEADDVMSLQFPMKNLLINEGNRGSDPDPSTSSSEVDELDSVPPGTYCVWTPDWDSVKASPSRCKKSKSTGSSASKRWKLLDLLRRSNSDGKNSFVFLTPSSSRSNSVDKKAEKAENLKEKRTSVSMESNKVAGKPKEKASVNAGGENKKSAHEVFYVRNRALKLEDKRRSYLPYRKDLVGFCAGLNGIPRTYPPF